ncbi:hypothetical protein [Elizabethkingia meningoseptica]|uniref:hypothetical protein n=1 Tax=Elizabethkingia meningoseptica TaxID=238 RepID=UPI0038917F44
MKKWLVLLGIVVFLTSCHHEWVLRPKIEGKILEESTKKPIVSKIATLPVDGELPEVVVSNKDNGYFYFPKISTKEWSFFGTEKPKGPPVTNKIIIQAEGYKTDTLDYTNYSSKDNVINIGHILLKKNIE